MKKKKEQKLRQYLQDRIDWLNHLIDTDYDKYGCYERRTEIQHVVIWMDKNL